MKEGQEKSKKCSKGAEKTEVNTFLFGTFEAACTGLPNPSQSSFQGFVAGLLKSFMDLQDESNLDDVSSPQIKICGYSMKGFHPV